MAQRTPTEAVARPGDQASAGAGEGALAGGGAGAYSEAPSTPETAGEEAPALPMRRETPAGVSTPELAVRAEAAVEAGVAGPAVEALLDLAAAHVRDGHPDAALDACYAALSLDPDSVELHLTLVELYDERGWAALAGEKLDLVDSLARLDADEAALARVAAVRAGRA